MKFTGKDRGVFVQIFIAFAQVTFGVFWASMFLPLDQYKITVILLNAIMTVFLIIGAWLLGRK